MRDWVMEALQAALEDRYTLRYEIGRGGMARVYVADDRRHRRAVAIKALVDIRDAMDPQRFLREIEMLALLQHPHILPLHDSGETPSGLLYYIAPFVEGETLYERMKRAPGRRLPVGDALRFAREIADALDYAHSRNVVHRDIKPRNILISDDHAVVADFGIARAIVATADMKKLTQSGKAVGTPMYMSPEQLLDIDVDGRADIYGLAVTLYETLAGELPFLGGRREVDNSLKFTQDPPHVRLLRPEVSERADAAIVRALGRLALDRFATAGEFARELTE